jgi:hypothetical protein
MDFVRGDTYLLKLKGCNHFKPKRSGTVALFKELNTYRYFVRSGVMGKDRQLLGDEGVGPIT